MNELNVTWLSQEFHSKVHDTLHSKMPRGRGKLYWRSKPCYLNKFEVEGKRHVIFLSYYATIGIIKKSIALRASGRYYTTLIAACVREDMSAELWFDQIYEIEHYREIQTLLADSDPYALIVASLPVEIPLITLSSYKGNYIFLDIQDTTLFLEPSPDNLACRLEHALLSRSAGFFHKMPDQAIMAMRALWPDLPSDHCVHALPCRAFFQDPNPASAPLQLVFAGGIIPYHIAVTRGHGNHVFDPLIEATARQRLRLKIFVNQNAREMFWKEHDHYFNFCRTYPSFEFVRGVPFNQLPNHISNAHFGLIYDNLAMASYPIDHFRYNMATKIFCYMEAGLPILVYEESEYISSLVREHNIGIVYRLENLHSLRRLLEQADQEALHHNVLLWREKNELSTILPRLETALER